MPRRLGKLSLHTPGLPLMDTRRTQHSRRRLREYLNALGHFSKLLEETEAHEHPELIGVRQTILRPTRGEMTANLLTDLVELGRRRGWETTDPGLIHSYFSSATVNTLRPWCTRSVDGDSTGSEPKLVTNLDHVVDRFPHEFGDPSIVEGGDVSLPSRRLEL